MAAVRDKNVRGKNGDRSVDTVDTIYWNTDLCKPVSVHKYLVHQNTRTPEHQYTSSPVHQYTSTQVHRTVTDLCKPVSGSQGRDSTLHHSKEDNILRISIWIAISFFTIWQIMISFLLFLLKMGRISFIFNGRCIHPTFFGGGKK